ncbi:ClpV1 family T6SS ATPase [Halopseudomonas oceani]|uniref:Type VI secretion system ATPase TssH n=1 Tax=Halopseudomonas oceani TaxID=1708783 RepID=A0A2P4EX08_9GAMM|nr:type VI secretion system ATPase TssH [Halopseudomonas oceani]POB04545.1 type VI secretion system ATPase TssH [Halopseudomonas oceani]GGE39349.1 ClpV1 family T6SS ATPase [Halopseudomonas oceani]
MIPIDLHQLINLLSDDLRSDLEQAAEHCLQRGGASVQPEDLLWALLQRTNNLLAQLLAASGQPVDAILSRCQLATESASTSRNPGLSVTLVTWLQQALLIASTELQQQQVDQPALLLGWLRNPLLHPDPLAGINAEQIQQLADGSPASKNDTPSLLESFTHDLTRQAADGKLDPVLGREREIRQLVDILCRRRKSNPVIIGDAGVGKSALVEGLAQRLVAGSVPDSLRGWRLLSLDLGLLQAGAGVRGELERRLQGVLSAASDPANRIILFIDEAHTLIGHGGEAGTSDTANLLKPALARGALKAIAATTWSEYRRHIEKDPALARRFQPLQLRAPSSSQAITLLRGLAPRYADSHGLHVCDDAVVAAVELAARYLPDRQLPDKAIDLLDTACARARVNLAAAPATLDQLHAALADGTRQREAIERDQQFGLPTDGELLDQLHNRHQKDSNALRSLQQQWSAQRELALQLVSQRHQTDVPHTEHRQALRQLQQEQALVSAEVDRNAIAEVVSEWTGIPLAQLRAHYHERITRFAENLTGRLHGQPEAIKQLDLCLRASTLGLARPDRPAGVFLLTGPSGVGKTATAEAIADLLYGGEAFLTTINMGEYQERHSLARLIGAPPGYVGYGEGGLLTEAVRRKPYSVVLLDEVEKADPQLLNLFYQIFDKGLATDGEGREIDFRNTVILLTANLGSEQIDHLCRDDARPTPGQLTDAIRPSLEAHFKPALLARMRVLPYYPITTDNLQAIASQRLDALIQRLQNCAVHCRFDSQLPPLIAERCMQNGGARGVERWIEDQVISCIADRLLQTDQATPAATKLYVSVDTERMVRCELA